MEYSSITEVFDALKRSKRKLKALEDKYTELEIRKEDIIYNYNSIGVKTYNRGGAFFENIVVNQSILQEKMLDAYVEYLDLLNKAFDVILLIENPLHAELLIYKFVEGLKYEEIRKKYMPKYDYDYLRSNLKKKAIKEAEEIFTKLKRSRSGEEAARNV